MKQIVFKTAKKKFVLKLPEKYFSSSISSRIFNLADLIYKIAVNVFLVSVIPLYTINLNYPLLLVYIIVPILVFSLLVKKVVSFGNFFPIVRFDILFLMFTTVITSSQFVFTILNNGQTYDIWGGRNLAYFSIYSLLNYSALFYALAIYFHKASITRQIEKFIFGIGVASAITLYNLLIGGETSLILVYFLACMIPAFIYSFGQFNLKTKVIQIFILAVAIYAWIKSADPSVPLPVVTIALALILLVQVIGIGKNLKNQLKSLSKGINEFFDEKSSFVSLYKSNAKILNVIFTLSALIALIVWFRFVNEGNILFNFKNELKYIKSSGFMEMLLGSGLRAWKGNVFLGFFAVYGLFSAISVLAIFVVLVKTFIIKQKSLNFQTLMFIVILSYFSIYSGASIILVSTFIAFAFLLAEDSNWAAFKNRSYFEFGKQKFLKIRFLKFFMLFSILVSIYFVYNLIDFIYSQIK